MLNPPVRSFPPTPSVVLVCVTWWHRITVSPARSSFPLHLYRRPLPGSALQLPHVQEYTRTSWDACIASDGGCAPGPRQWTQDSPEEFVTLQC